jgi:hypothetical protein
VDLTGLNISTTAANLSWNLIPKQYQNGIIIGYRVHYDDFMGHSGSIILPALQRHVILKGLLSYTLYNISVAGLTKAGEAWNRTFVLIRTNAGGTVGLVISHFQLPSLATIYQALFTINSTIMRPINMIVIHYYHHHDHHHYHHTISSTPSTPPLSTTINHYPLGSSNSITITATTIIHHPVKLLFLFNIAPTREPWELICSGVSSYTISLHWYRFTPDLTGSRLTGYFVSYRAIDPPDPTMYNVTLKPFKHNYVVENLKAYTNYSFELHVFNPWGKSNTSSIVCKTEEGSMEKNSFCIFTVIVL